MSYWIYLRENDEPVSVDPHCEGGTIQVGGCSAAEINVTYNYSKLFPFMGLNGLTGEQSTPFLSDAVQRLGVVPHEDYWNPTNGNVGRCCKTLLTWAKANLQAVWEVSP